MAGDPLDFGFSLEAASFGKSDGGKYKVRHMPLGCGDNGWHVEIVDFIKAKGWLELIMLPKDARLNFPSGVYGIERLFVIDKNGEFYPPKHKHPEGKDMLFRLRNIARAVGVKKFTGLRELIGGEMRVTTIPKPTDNRYVDIENYNPVGAISDDEKIAAVPKTAVEEVEPATPEDTWE